MIETDRLLIARMDKHTSADVLAQQVIWLNDKEAMRYSDQRHMKHTVDTQTSYIKKQNHDFQIWNISALDGSIATLGTMSAYFDRNNCIADMGIMIGPPYRGQRYSVEAWYGLLDWLLQSGEAYKVECGFYANNIPMYMVARKKMTYEGQRRRHFIGPGGMREDLILFGTR